LAANLIKIKECVEKKKNPDTHVEVVKSLSSEEVFGMPQNQALALINHLFPVETVDTKSITGYQWKGKRKLIIGESSCLEHAPEIQRATSKKTIEFEPGRSGWVPALVPRPKKNNKTKTEQILPSDKTKIHGWQHQNTDFRDTTNNSIHNEWQFECLFREIVASKSSTDETKPSRKQVRWQRKALKKYNSKHNSVNNVWISTSFWVRNRVHHIKKLTKVTTPRVRQKYRLKEITSARLNLFELEENFCDTAPTAQNSLVLRRIMKLSIQSIGRT
jgi:hypothetical protein